MASYPTTPVVFPTRADATTIFAEHMNAVQEEIAAIEAALILTAGETNADIRLRKAGNALEWGHPTAGRQNVLASDAGTGVGFIGFNCEAGTNINTYRTRGVSGLVLKSTSGILSANYVAGANADNQALLEYFRADTQGITIPQVYAGRLGHWAPYTPVWAATGTAPALGNGALTGKYTVVGKTVFVTINFTMGSTSTQGTGAWTFSLPAGFTSPLGSQIGGYGRMIDYGTTYRQLVGYLSGTTVSFWVDAVVNALGPNVPVVWAANDGFGALLTYETD